MTHLLLRCNCRRCGLTAALLASCLAAQPMMAEEPVFATPAVAAADYVAPEDPRELLRLDDAMRQFFAQRVTPRSVGCARLSEIVDAIFREDGLNFAYDADATFDVRETFRRRRGNCASFAFLVVAVTREFGLKASFQMIDRTTKWDRVGGIVVAVLHLSAQVTTADGTYVVDLDPNVVAARHVQRMNVVPDETAFAQFYSNTGFDLLVRGDTDGALRFMKLATRVDPKCASAWANLATLHARLGDLAAAKAGFERSLRADSTAENALDGFVSVLRRLGSPEDLRKADKLERRARAIRDRNPYYQQELAHLAQERGDLAAAEKLLRRAISLKGDEPDFYVQRVAVLQQLGRSSDARREADRLDKLRDQLASVSEHVRP